MRGCFTVRTALGDRSGVTALEFALVAPLFLGLVFSTFEAGWMMTKATLLDRALDVTVRDIRIGGTGAPQTQSEIRDAVCAEALVFLDCAKSLTIEMNPVTTAADFPSTAATCIDRGAAVQPVVNFRAAQRSATVFIRACVVSDPLTPLLGLALHLPKDSRGGYRLESSGAFVAEPST
ncbi:TadE/TadG family type IV pilus assembly protein [Aureimonas sp. AU12]|jgi:Flp pilus assembly protein TadG|uniref:TadE/TadG family type IV pilus assembly protein n=1 Tax=Aureimonas sp. AU12 TaxID=1638161 RepID=UPI0007847D9D|nr:TadE/TadG family type IV pilus assembly protein [Aureimonas sp. AU12]